MSLSVLQPQSQEAPMVLGKSEWTCWGLTVASPSSLGSQSWSLRPWWADLHKGKNPPHPVLCLKGQANPSSRKDTRYLPYHP